MMRMLLGFGISQHLLDDAVVEVQQLLDSIL